MMELAGLCAKGKQDNMSGGEIRAADIFPCMLLGTCNRFRLLKTQWRVSDVEVR
jgi:hypothetical protein